MGRRHNTLNQNKRKVLEGTKGEEDVYEGVKESPGSMLRQLTKS